MLVQRRTNRCRLDGCTSSASSVGCFYLAFDANHLGRLVRGVRGDGYALINWANALGVVAYVDDAGRTWHDGILVALGYRATARSFASRDDQWLGAVVGNRELAAAVSTLGDGSVIVNVFVQRDGWALRRCCRHAHEEQTCCQKLLHNVLIQFGEFLLLLL